MFNDGEFASPVPSFGVPITPPDTDPDTGGVMYVFYNPAWAQAVLGALTQLLQAPTWNTSDPDDVNTALYRATVLMNLLAGSTASQPGVPGFGISLVRFNSSTGHVESSSDSGATWQTNPDADVRTSPAYKLPASGKSTCDAANNIVMWFEAFFANVERALSAGATGLGLFSVVVGFLVELGPFAWLVELITTLGSFLATVGYEVLFDTFTSTAFDTLRCELYCLLDSDGTLSSDGLTSWQATYRSDLGATAADILDACIEVMGVNGVNNAAQLGSSTGDCSGCPPCLECFLDGNGEGDMTPRYNGGDHHGTASATYDGLTDSWQGVNNPAGTYCAVFVPTGTWTHADITWVGSFGGGGWGLQVYATDGAPTPIYDANTANPAHIDFSPPLVGSSGDGSGAWIVVWTSATVAPDHCALTKLCLQPSA